MIPNQDLFDALVERFPSVDRKGKTMPYTSLNGHMFSFLDKEGQLGLRLSVSDKEEFRSIYGEKDMIQHGRVMKEYVVVEKELMSNNSEIDMYFQKSVDYVASLKPKASKKK